ncbi:MAG: SLBB domain-containing protein [Calditrichaceae bacterium]
MHRIFIFIFLSLFCITQIRGQSLEDLKKVEELRKQLEQAGKTIEKPEQVTPSSSMTTFRDSLSQMPANKIEVASKRTELGSNNLKVSTTDSLAIFGHAIFNNVTVDYTPEIYGPVDEDYPVGPGDEVIITVWGEVELRHELTVDRDGQIYIPQVGLIKTNGNTISQLTKRLKTEMGKSYSSLKKGRAFIDVTLGKLRPIRVYVVGEVNNPGIFTVPALTSAFNMLFYAGGVTETASLRTISLIRNDQEFANLDFYDFITGGKKYPNIRLQNYDVILIKTIQKKVSWNGAVKKPAIYELKDDEGIFELVNYSGGFSSDAYIENINIRRFIDNKDQKLMSINYKELRSVNTNFPLQDGDQIRVDTLNRELDDIIKISGPIYGPREFAFHEGLTIEQLFNVVDSIRGDAYLERVSITRMMPNQRKQIFSINLADILQSSNLDFVLAPGDQISILSDKTLFPEDSVKIFGAVNEAGTFLLKKDMTLKDLIFAAGGFREDALIDKAEISRIDPANNDQKQLANLIYVDLDSNYTKNHTSYDDEQFYLQAYDNVFIRSNSDWEVQRNVTINGEVRKPGIYTLKSKTERVSDLIARAGGLKPTAYLDGGVLTRSYNNVGRIGIDFNNIYKNTNSEENIFLQDGDVITIPEKLHTIKVIGGVNFPSSVLYEKGAGLDYYIKAAGGFVELADKKNVTIRLPNGRPIVKKRFLFWSYLSNDITAGTTIYVPVLTAKEGVDWSGAIRDAAAILSSVATTILIIDRLK